MIRNDLLHHLNQLHQQGLELWLDDEQLRFKANKSQLSPQVLALLREHKADIIALLQQQPKRFQGFLLSEGQRAIYLMQNIAKNSAIYHLSCLLRLQKKPDSTRLQTSVNQLVQQHGMLRSSFTMINGQFIQETLAHCPIEIEYLHCTADLSRFANHLSERTFILQQAPLFRVSVIEHENAFYLLLNAHHLIADFWAMRLLIEDLQALYLTQTLLHETSSYKDFVLYEQQWLVSDEALEAKNYWHKTLSPVPEPLTLPYDKAISSNNNYQGEELQFQLSSTLSQQLKTQAKAQQSTPFAWLLSCYQLLMQRLSASDDIAIGTPVINRAHKSFQHTIGHFANPVVLRSKLNTLTYFADLLQHNKEQIRQAIKYQQYPFQRLVEELNATHNSHSSPLFQVAFSWNQLDSEINTSAEFIQDIQQMTQHGAMYHLVLTGYEQAEHITLSWRFNHALFSEKTIQRFQQYFLALLEQSVKDAKKPLNTFTVLTEQEKALWQRINATDSVIPQQESLASLWQKNCQKAPHHIAFRDAQTQLSISAETLDNYSNQIAHFMQQQGLVAGDVVGLAFGRGYQHIAWLLACVKSGIIYIPIDTQNPDERIASILHAAKARGFVTAQQHPLAAQCEIFIALEQQQQAIAALPTQFPLFNQGRVQHNATACIFFTSGSTGTPKGVEIPHRAIVRLTHNTNFAQIGAKDTFLHLCNIGFDASNVELWFSLLHGATLLYIDQEHLLNPARFAAIIAKEKPTAAIMTTALFNVFIQYKADIFKDFRYVMFGGEAADPHSCNLCLQHGKPESLLNVYGPTENGTFSSAYNIEQAQDVAVPIGYVISNSQAYIFDQYQQLAPIGVIGELVVGGEGVSTGYYLREDLTAQQFYADTLRGTGLLYRTGDLAWLREDGMLMYAGRCDEQIKLRGFRIETKEIEQYLLAIPSIEQAFVDLDASKNHLIAWLVADSTLDSAAIKQQLAQHLPSFMLPSAFVQLDALPLTANGKIDKQRLPAPIISASSAFVAASSPLEKQMQALWQDILAIETIGIDDNFFELGGHSLLASRLIAKIEEELTIALDLAWIFQHPTIQTLCRAIENNPPANLLEITKASVTEAVPASLSQRRLWFLQKLNPTLTAYNMPLALRLNKTISHTQLEDALLMLFQRHDSLQYAFAENDGEPLLVNAGIKPALAHVKINDADVNSTLQSFNQQIFALNTGPLIQALLIETEQQTLLALCLHHSIVDGLSLVILLSEFAAILQQRPLTPLTWQYRDFSHWQHQQQSQALFNKQRDYWRHQLKDANHFLQLPTDKPRPSILGSQGGEVVFTLEKNLVDQLKVLAQTQQVSLFMLMMAGYSLLLNKLTGQEELCVGFPISGRSQQAWQSVVGLFVNNLALRCTLSPNITLGDYLQQIKQTTLQAFAHQDIPFDHIIEALTLETNLSYTPFLQASFSLEEKSLADQITQSLHGDFSYVEQPWQVAKYDINLACYPQDDGTIRAHFEYNTDLFEPHTLQQWAHYYQQVLQQLLTPATPVKTLSLLSVQEQTRYVQAIASLADCPHVIERFSFIAEKHAKRCALSLDEESISYQTLNTITNQLAHRLLAEGICQGDFVGLYFDRSLAMIYTILALFKIGAAYVPLDPHSPTERVQYIINDAKLRFIISEQPLAEITSCTVLDSATLLEQSQQESIQKPIIPLSLDQAAYVIYTSGTTGNPKGCVVTQHNLARLFTSSEPQYQFTEQDIWCLFHSYAFDVSVWEMWGALLYGGELILIPYWLSRSSEQFYQLLADKKVTILNQTPSAFSQIVRIDKERQQTLALRCIIFAGEALDFSLLRHWVVRHPLTQTRLVNMYGITETTVHVTYHAVSDADLIHARSIIGEPLADLHIYLLDAQQALVPDGVIGEIYVSGPGVTLGYLHRPELTAERFINNPFSHLSTNADHNILYRSGDLAKRLANGTLEYLGRIDHQVKIRGHRIELGEVETALNDIEGIQESLVRTQQNDADDTQLVAWIIGEQASLDLQDIRRQLKLRLPDYMIPNAFIPLSAWPLTGNGKVDMRALPKADMTLQQRRYVAPRNATEETLCAIWQDILSLEKVGIEDNFFEIGGHSLLATKLATRIQTQLQCDLALQHIFTHPTIEELAVLILQQTVTQLELSDEQLLALLAELDE